MSSSPQPDWEHNRSKYRNDGTAQEYDVLRYRGFFRGRLKGLLHQAALRRAFRDVPAGSTVLDIPCGTGRFTNWLLGQGYRVMGADISANMLTVARGKVPDAGRDLLGFLSTDVLALPYANKSVDATLTVRFFHLVPAELRPRVYRELARVSRGQVILCMNCNKWALKILAKRLRGKTSQYWMGRGELKVELAAAGLEMERIHSKGGILSTLWIVVCRPMET